MNAKTLKQHATTLVLSVLVIGALIYLRFVDRGSVTTAESEARKRNLLPAFRMDGLSELRIFAWGKNARLYRGKEDEDGERPWMLELEGKHYPTDRQTVDQFLSSLDYGVTERKVDEQGVSRADMKLDQPRVRISLSMDGKSMELLVGGEAASPQGAVYALREGEGPVVITKQLFEALNLDPQHFRSRAFSPYLISELGAIGLSGEGGTRKLGRAAFSASRSPVFRLEGPGAFSNLRVRDSSTEKLIFALTNLQAEGFLSAEQVQSLPQAPVLLSLFPRDERKPSIAIELGAPCPLEGHKEEWVAAIRKGDPPMAACVPKSVMEAMTQPEEALVDQRLFAATADAVSELKMSMGKEVLEIARKDSKWHERTPHDRDIEADMGKGLVDSLLSLSGKLEAGDPKALGLEEPRAVLRLISTAEAMDEDGGPGERIEEIEIGAEKNGLVYVRRLEDGALLSIAAEKAVFLLPNELSLRSLQILDEPLKRFRSLSIREGKRVQAFERTESGSFKLLSPKGKGLSADIGLVSDAAELLGSLRAERWVAAQDSAEFGLSAPRMVVEAELSDSPEDHDDKDSKSKTIRLLVGAVGGDGSFAKLSGDDAVFVLPKKFEEAFSRWLLDRSALGIEAQGLEMAKLVRASGKSCTVERGAKGILRASGDCDSEAPAKVRDALSDLLAEGVISLGASPKHEGFDKPLLKLMVKSQAGDESKTLNLSVGSKDIWRGAEVYYVRREGLDLSYAVHARKIKPLIDAVTGP